MRLMTSTTALAVAWGLSLLLGCASGSENDAGYVPRPRRNACDDVRKRLSLLDGQPIPKGVFPPKIKFFEPPAASQKPTGSVACVDVTVGADGLLHDIRIVKVVGSVQWAKAVEESLTKW